jgi:hypothetical protein
MKNAGVCWWPALVAPCLPQNALPCNRRVSATDRSTRTRVRTSRPMRGMALTPVQTSGNKLQASGDKKSPRPSISTKTKGFPGQTAPPWRFLCIIIHEYARQRGRRQAQQCVILPMSIDENSLDAAKLEMLPMMKVWARNQADQPDTWQQIAIVRQLRLSCLRETNRVSENLGGEPCDSSTLRRAYSSVALRFASKDSIASRSNDIRLRASSHPA